MSNYQLTKSSFLSGLQCPKKLWRETNIPDQDQQISAAQRQRFETGLQVGVMARSHFDGGVLVNERDVDGAVNHTLQCIEQGVPVIFEAAFLHDECFVRTDILQNNGNGTWNLTEVKSSTSVKGEYLYDAAFQYWCLVGSGLKINRVFVQHINNLCVYPNLEDLFTTVDVTNDVIALQPEIDRHIKEFKQMLSNPKEPDVQIGEHCVKPYECDFKNDCWQNVPKQSVFEIPGLRWDKKNELVAAGIYAMADIGSTVKLSDGQRQHVSMVKSGIPLIDKSAIAVKLASLKYPLYFLDFETNDPAIPRFNNARPYQAFPFQYSCHILHKDERLSHLEYLHEDRTDPRRLIAERLLQDLGTEGTIVAYNASFEIRIIQSLVDLFDDLADQLKALIPRFWDQLDVFKQDYHHPDFGGSNSIKSVLPVLVPELNYDQLEQVHEGTEAGAEWNNMLLDLDEDRRLRTFANLRAYCELDTLAMVKIYEKLMKEINS